MSDPEKRCPVSEAEVAYDGGGDMPDWEYKERFSQVLENEFARIFEILTELSDDDQAELVYQLFRNDGRRDLMAAARVMFDKAYGPVMKLIEKEIDYLELDNIEE